MQETDFQNVQNNLKGLIIFVQKVMKITYILAKNSTENCCQPNILKYTPNRLSAHLENYQQRMAPARSINCKHHDTCMMGMRACQNKRQPHTKLAYSYHMEQIMNSVCVSVSLSVSVCVSVMGTFTVAFFIDFHQNQHCKEPAKVKAIEFVWVNTALPFPLFCPQNPILGQEVLKIHAKIK